MFCDHRACLVIRVPDGRQIQSHNTCVYCGHSTYVYYGPTVPKMSDIVLFRLFSFVAIFSFVACATAIVHVCTIHSGVMNSRS